MIAVAATPELLARFKGVRRSGDGWVARCPAHDDRRQSLSIGTGTDGRVLLHCHAGCEPAAIVRAVGLELADLFPPRDSHTGNGKPERRIIEIYDYHDANGVLRFQVVRFAPKDFRARQPDGRGGWRWSLEGVEPLLYRLPDVIEAIALEKRIYVVEGEKDADALRHHGIVATTSPQGAGKWRDSYSAVLRDADIVILPDNDEPGRRHADQVISSLTGVARSIVRIELPGLPPKGDVSDWLAQGHTVKDLEALVAAAPKAERRQLRYTLGELKARPELLAQPEYVIYRLVARHRSTLLYAREKDGKSTFVAFTLAVKSSGGAMLGSICRSGTVLLIALEEFVGDVVQRLVRLGGHDDRLHIVTELAGTTIEERLAEVRQHIVETRAEYVCVDTLIALVAGRVESTNDDGDMQPVVQGLTDIAHQTGCGMLIVAHANKSGASWRGSGAIGGSVDVVAEMTIPEPENDPNLRELRVRGRIPVEHFRVRYVGTGFEEAMSEAADVSARVLDFVSTRPGCSQAAIRTAVGGKASLVDSAVVRMVEKGKIVDRGDGRRHAYWAADDPLVPPVPAGRAWDEVRDEVRDGPDYAPDPGEALPPASGRPGGTGLGRGADDLRDGQSGAIGQLAPTPEGPLKGDLRGVPSPGTASNGVVPHA